MNTSINIKETPVTPKVPEIKPRPEKADPKLPNEKPGVAPKEKPERSLPPDIKPVKE